MPTIALARVEWSHLRLTYAAYERGGGHGASLLLMGPGNPSKTATPGELCVSREDEADLQAALEEAANESGRVVTPDELKRWAETGEWPDGSD